MIDRKHSLISPGGAFPCSRAQALSSFACSCVLAVFLLLAPTDTFAQTPKETKGEAKGETTDKTKDDVKDKVKDKDKGDFYKTLVLRTRHNAQHKFNIEIAATPAEQSRGLMFRTNLPAKHGMLFLYDPPQQVVMWMKNTYLPLDMIFLDEEGKVVQIVERTTPLSLARISSARPIAAVLELAAGSVHSLSLAKGDQAEHPFFKR